MTATLFAILAPLLPTLKVAAFLLPFAALEWFAGAMEVAAPPPGPPMRSLTPAEWLALGRRHARRDPDLSHAARAVGLMLAGALTAREGRLWTRRWGRFDQDAATSSRDVTPCSS